ncbi:UNVERIFIED_CONTAM: hypothetical protein GTU68_030498, partial [Idotea baltica]|nr:hypothetical protein [Idotea baltica]
MAYNPSNIEQKWQDYWKQEEIYKVENHSDRPKYYVLDMFPYPSGAGLHVGHPLGYIASDIYSRFKRLSGYNVLHPMGFDAFGLPAEQYALQTGIHPADSTRDNMARYREQMSKLGFSYDWSREIATCEPKYYKWTQWIFKQLFNHYYDQDRKIGSVNWCEELGTVLANDQIKDGRSERGGYPVVQKAMTQWALRITAYADRLLDDIDTIDWSESLKTIQSNWIGRSRGARVQFKIANHSASIEIFTTRPDTIFGATYMVLAPEHDLVSQLTTPDQKSEVEAYLTYVNARSEVERMAEKETTGVFIGSYVIHPFTDQKVPIWIGEYVLKDYGTGAIMAVPSDDDRDYNFAQKFNLPIIQVVDKSEHPNSSKKDKIGTLINSDFLNGLPVTEAIDLIIQNIEEKGIGDAQINYKMRDANFSRQRYWGEPFPIKYDQQGIAYALPDSKLPVELPATDDFKPAAGGQSPLSRITSWTDLPDDFVRETDTMPAVAGSSWYFLRYMDPNNDEVFASQDAINYWQDVDLYVGGAEHAVSHLMYARFWHKFLYDKGLVPTIEPFKKLINQGMIQEVGKMSKSYFNVVNPDDVIARYGTDCFRMYEMFLGPIEQSKPWDTNGIDGVSKFLKKYWNL